MLAIHHILFPVDFSERCAATAPFVKTMATRFGARISMISVAPPLWQAMMAEPGGAVMFDMQQVRKDLESRLQRTLVRELDGVPVEKIAEIGDPSSAIVEFAHSNGVDLIMMPTRGHGPFRRLLLGSVTAKVLHDALCPVWTNAHAEEPEATSHVSGEMILCAVDGTPRTVPLMQWAACYARDTGAVLRIVHAISGVEGWPEREMDSEFQKDVHSRARETIEKQKRETGVTAPLCIGAGDVPHVVREEAQRHNADLVIIGRGVLHETLGRLRTHSYGIIRNAPCPVLSL